MEKATMTEEMECFNFRNWLTGGLAYLSSRPGLATVHCVQVRVEIKHILACIGTFDYLPLKTWPVIKCLTQTLTCCETTRIGQLCYRDCGGSMESSQKSLGFKQPVWTHVHTYLKKIRLGRLEIFRSSMRKNAFSDRMLLDNIDLKGGLAVSENSDLVGTEIKVGKRLSFMKLKTVSNFGEKNLMEKAFCGFMRDNSKSKQTNLSKIEDTNANGERTEYTDKKTTNKGTRTGLSQQNSSNKRDKNFLITARNGFYHDPTDGPTSTRCYLCDARRSTWEYFDNIEVEHRRQSPDCHFHSNRSEESINVSISYESTSQSRRAPPSSTPDVNSTVVSSAISSCGTASLSQSQTSSHTIYQPRENDENRERSLLALINSRPCSALDRSGEKGNTNPTTSPGRNNYGPGSSIASLDGFASREPTSTATDIVSSSIASSTGTSTSTVLNQQSSTLAGAFRGKSLSVYDSNASTTSKASASTSTTSSSSTLRSFSSPAAAGSSSLLRPTQIPIGGGGRTDPTITVVVNNAKHPDYRELDARVNSYQGWPDYLDQTSRQMAEAGFFFVGVADFTRCFCCGGGLRNWEPGDDPMLEHTRWFPRCEYVNKLKGERYVAAVQRRHQQHMEEQQRQQQELARSRDANRNPPDPMSTEAAAILREMGYQQEKIRDAILAVRRQIGVPDVTTQQVLAWLLDQHEAGSSPTSTRSSPTRDLGVKVNDGLASLTIQTSSQSSVVNTTSTPTTTSTTLAGARSGSTSVRSSKGGAGSQQTSSSISNTISPGSKETGSKLTFQTGSKANKDKEGKSLGKQSAASGGESDDDFKSAEEFLETPSSEVNPAKKKNRKKRKSNSRAKSSGASGGLGVDAQALKEENEKLREMQTCKICMERPVNTTLLPCGHLICCDLCAARLNKCPICRKRIKGTVKTFMS